MKPEQHNPATLIAGLKKQLLDKEEENALLLSEVLRFRRHLSSDRIDAIATLRSELQRSQTILKLSCDIHWDFYPETMTTIFSKDYMKITGWDQMIYRSFEETKRLVHPDDLNMFVENIKKVISGETLSFNYDFRWLCAKGGYMWMNNRCFGLKNTKGKVDYIIGLSNNITEYKKQQAILQEEQLKNQLLVRTATDYIWEYDMESKVFTFSKELTEVLGEETGKKQLDSECNQASLCCLLLNFVETTDIIEVENIKFDRCLRIFSRKKHRYLWFEVSYFPLKNTLGKHYKFIGTMHDISDKKHLEEIANHDPLTRALNRRATHEILKEGFQRFGKTKQNTGILFIDLDDFKKVNDTLGHAAGDFVLQEIVRIFGETAQYTANICRWGGEEFVITCDCIGQRELLEYAERLRCTIENTPICWNRKEIRITISIGVSVFDDRDNDYNAAIQRADKAVYQVKAMGKNAVLLREPTTIPTTGSNHS